MCIRDRDNRERHFSAAKLATRERPWTPVEKMLDSRQARCFAVMAPAVAALEKRELPFQLETRRQQFVIGQVEHAMACEHGKRSAREGDVAHPNDTGVGLKPANSDLQQRGFALAISTEDRSHFAGLGSKRRRREHSALAECLAHAISNQGVHQRWTSASRHSAGTAAAAYAA